MILIISWIFTLSLLGHHFFTSGVIENVNLYQNPSSTSVKDFSHSTVINL